MVVIKPITSGHINPCKNMVCHTFQPLFDYTAGQFVNNSIVSFCGGNHISHDCFNKVGT